MKKYIAGILTVLFFVTLTSMVFAANMPHQGGHPSQDAKITKNFQTGIAPCEMQKVGEVISINNATGEVVVKDEKDNSSKTIVLNQKDLKRIKSGSTVSFILSHTSNKVESIEVLEKTKVK
jgi:hypothetical protein